MTKTQTSPQSLRSKNPYTFQLSGSKAVSFKFVQSEDQGKYRVQTFALLLCCQIERILTFGASIEDWKRAGAFSPRSHPLVASRDFSITREAATKAILAGVAVSWALETYPVHVSLAGAL